MTRHTAGGKSFEGTHLYDDLIMDHIKNARNYRVLEDDACRATGTNPLCGDEMLVYLKMNGERIADIAFQCTCCGISMASASMMTDMVKGRLAEEARRVVREIVTMVESRTHPAIDDMSAERLALLETVRKFPTRAGCAALAWTTLQDALDTCATSRRA